KCCTLRDEESITPVNKLRSCLTGRGLRITSNNVRQSTCAYTPFKVDISSGIPTEQHGNSTFSPPSLIHRFILKIPSSVLPSNSGSIYSPIPLRAWDADGVNASRRLSSTALRSILWCTRYLKKC